MKVGVVQLWVFCLTILAVDFILFALGVYPADKVYNDTVMLICFCCGATFLGWRARGE